MGHYTQCCKVLINWEVTRKVLSRREANLVAEDSGAVRQAPMNCIYAGITKVMVQRNGWIETVGKTTGEAAKNPLDKVFAGWRF